MMPKFWLCAALVVTINGLSVFALGHVPTTPTAAPQVDPEAPAEKVVAIVGTDKITDTQVDAITRSQLRGRRVPP